MTWSPATTGTESWELQPGEPGKWYHRFHEFYLLLGPERMLEAAFRRWQQQQHVARGQQSAANSGGRRRPSPQWFGIARTWSWSQRAAEWDVHERRRKMAARAKKLEALHERHTTFSHAAFNKLILRLQNTQPEEFSATETIRLAIEVIKLERLLHGEPIDHQKLEHSGPAGGPIASAVMPYEPSPEELERVIALWTKYAPLDEESAESTPEATTDPGAKPEVEGNPREISQW